MRLCDALGVQRGEIIAFTGAGGKTSATMRLGAELRAEGWRILATTTTRIALEEMQAFPHALRFDKITSPVQLDEKLEKYGMVFLYERTWGGKAIGIPPERIADLADRVASDAIIIEADGARRFPLKAPFDHEPVIPPDTSLAVPVAGMDAVGMPLNEQAVYNLQKIIDRYGFLENTPIQPAWIAQIIRDETIGLQGIPEHTRIVPLLNKTGMTVRERLRARRAAQLILHEKRIQAVAIGRVQHRKQPIFETQRR
ncbi:MAG TPA: selenium cofactor biosynthesis protein YqeC, partial [Aggregatilineales bacterium]|nr:selenium cofactor biosynthesis protein YqeC [Aggregatilineales bacterium]